MAVKSAKKRKQSKPEIVLEDVWKVSVSPDNPGEFFACVGLQWLSSSMAGRGLACRFSKDNGKWAFHLDESGPSLAEIVSPLLAEGGVLAPPTYGSDIIWNHPCKVNPVLVLPHHKVSIDFLCCFELAPDDEPPPVKADKAWRKNSVNYRQREHGTFKFWAGNTTPRTLVKDLGEYITAYRRRTVPIWYGGPDLFEVTRIKRNAILRVDARSITDAVVAGFRRTKANRKCRCSVITEVLAAAGLQAVRPCIRDSVFAYHAWYNPLRPLLAQAAVLGGLETPGTTFQCRLNYLDKYKYLRYSIVSEIPIWQIVKESRG